MHVDYRVRAKLPRSSDSHAKSLYLKQLADNRSARRSSRKDRILLRKMGFPPHLKVKFPHRLAARRLGLSPVGWYFADSRVISRYRVPVNNTRTSAIHRPSNSLQRDSRTEGEVHFTSSLLTPSSRSGVGMGPNQHGKPVSPIRSRSLAVSAFRRLQAVLSPKLPRSSYSCQLRINFFASTQARVHAARIGDAGAPEDRFQRWRSSKSKRKLRDWMAWLQKSDAQVRQRLDIGEEDSLTNLLRFGVTYTKEYRIDDDYLVLLRAKQPGQCLRREPRQRSNQGPGSTQREPGVRRDAGLRREEKASPSTRPQDARN